MTDAGLQHLKELSQLRELNLDDTKVSDVGLEQLKGLTQLRELRLDGTNVTVAGVKKLQQTLPHCRIPAWHESQARAIAEIEKLGGEVTFDPESRSKPVAYRVFWPPRAPTLGWNTLKR